MLGLTIAGFDPSNGAGVTADLQTFAAHGLLGTAAVTALTVQSTLGVFAVEPVSPDLLGAMLQRLREDLAPRGIKIGMLASAENLAVIATFLRDFAADKPLVVLDPVLRSSSGSALLAMEDLEPLHRTLLPIVDWVTPNWAELAVLTGLAVNDFLSAEHATAALGRRHPHLTVVTTGGDADPPVDLLRLPGGDFHRLPGTRIETRSTHGTGCAFSSALLARLLQGESPLEAVRLAKQFVEGALRRAPDLGAGRGPMNLLWPLHGGLGGSATLKTE